MRAHLRELMRRLLREYSAPGQLATAVAVGVVIGCSPFYGIHIWIGLLFAWIFRLNKVAVILGSQISIPPLAPFIAFAGIQIGARILHGSFLSLTLADFTPARLPSLIRGFLLNWLVGGLVVGGVLAIPAFFAVYVAAQRREKRRARRVGSGADPAASIGLGGRTDDTAESGMVGSTEDKVGDRAEDRAGAGAESDASAKRDVGDHADWRDAQRRALELYRGARPGQRGYLWFKIRMDPVYRLICERLGRVDSVVDLGTGLALLPALLAVRGQAAQIVGIEWDEAKLAGARRACSRFPNVVLQAADARSFPIPPADAVCIVDLLHYYSIDEQRALLARAAAALHPGGRLVIRETIASRRGAVRLTRFLEWLSMRIGWNRGPGLVYRESDDLLADLASLGLECQLEGASSSVHAGNMLIWALKPAHAEEPA